MNPITDTQTLDSLDEEQRTVFVAEIEKQASVFCLYPSGAMLIGRTGTDAAKGARSFFNHQETAGDVRAKAKQIHES